MEAGAIEGNCRALAVLWIDNVPVTMLMTIHNIHGSKSHMIMDRKCSWDTSSNAARVWQLFRPNEFVKLLSIPSYIHDYNQFMGGVDIID